MSRLVSSLVETKIKWQTLLHRFLQKNIIVDYSWSRPSKKSQACGIYLPSPSKENMEIVVHIDTSGSISDDMLALYISEINSIFNLYVNISIDVISGDSRLRSVTKLGSNKRMSAKDIDLSGGGGTSHKFALEWIKENKASTQVLVSFTDGYSDIEHVWEKYSPRFKTIFIGIKGQGNCDDIMKKHGTYVESEL